MKHESWEAGRRRGDQKGGGRGAEEERDWREGVGVTRGCRSDQRERRSSELRGKEEKKAILSQGVGKETRGSEERRKRSRIGGRVLERPEGVEIISVKRKRGEKGDIIALFYGSRRVSDTGEHDPHTGFLPSLTGAMS